MDDKTEMKSGTIKDLIKDIQNKGVGEMIIEFKNQELQIVGIFLRELGLKGKESRARTLLCKRLEDKLKDYIAELGEIQKEYAKKDDVGNVMTSEGSALLFETEEDERVYYTEANRLAEEEAVIDCTEVMAKMKSLLAGLENLDVELKGNDAAIYDAVCEQLENLQTEEEEN